MAEIVPPKIAIVGGGITGACAAAALSSDFDVTLFDQGRRGAGGRASHRRVSAAADKAVLPDDELLPTSSKDTYEFDHGCQFTRADEPRFAALVAEWCERGWLAPWLGRFGELSVSSTAADASVASASPVAPDFFGLPGSAAPVYIGVGGMHQLPRRVLGGCAAKVRGGVCISRLEAVPGGWKLHTLEGAAAFHDTPVEEYPDRTSRQNAGLFDAVLLTDASSALGEWHRASAGIPDAFAPRVQQRVRVPLFSCMVAFTERISDYLPYDGITVRDSEALWFAARSQSKPGVPHAAAECWTLISTPAYAVAEITETPMQDSAGAFLPQDNGYLNSDNGPGGTLLSAFAHVISPFLKTAGVEMPRALYLQAQRWGSALPAPAGSPGRDQDGASSSTCEVMGIRYEPHLPSLVPAAAPPSAERAAVKDYLFDDELKLFYAGDFCSQRSPGFEAAALSALDAAAHIRQLLVPSGQSTQEQS